MRHEHGERLYRLETQAEGLVSFRVVVRESDLLVWAERDLSQEVAEEVLGIHDELEGFMELHRRFRDSLVPYDVPDGSPAVVRSLAEAAKAVGVGPMAGVAGVVADRVGSCLLRESREVIVENGGDLFVATRRERKVGIYAGSSPLSGKLALSVPPAPDGYGICTSSATVGPSLSLGIADVALVKADSAVLADAAASALGNRVKKEGDIEGALAFILDHAGIQGALVIVGDRLGIAGDIMLA